MEQLKNLRSQSKKESCENSHMLIVDGNYTNTFFMKVRKSVWKPFIKISKVNCHEFFIKQTTCSTRKTDEERILGSHYHYRHFL